MGVVEGIHTDDITQVCARLSIPSLQSMTHLCRSVFTPRHQQRFSGWFCFIVICGHELVLFSGSLDGTINLYDMNVADPDDALQSCKFDRTKRINAVTVTDCVPNLPYVHVSLC